MLSKTAISSGFKRDIKGLVTRALSVHSSKIYDNKKHFILNEVFRIHVFFI